MFVQIAIICLCLPHSFYTLDFFFLLFLKYCVVFKILKGVKDFQILRIFGYRPDLLAQEYGYFGFLFHKVVFFLVPLVVEQMAETSSVVLLSAIPEDQDQVDFQLGKISAEMFRMRFAGQSV